MDELPSSYDVIVVGTGMTECIFAAAAARVGKTVLHLDRNSYYGGEWASFNFDQIQKWIDENKSYDQNASPVERNTESCWQDLIGEGEQLIPCCETFPSITNVKEILCIREKLDIVEVQVPSPSACERDVAESPSVTSPESTCASKQTPEVQSANEESTQDTTNHCAQGDTQLASNFDAPESGEICGQDSTSEQGAACGEATVPPAGGESEMTSVLESANEENKSCDDASGECAASHSISAADEEKLVTPVKKIWTLEDLKSHHRKFNIDLSPKLLFARGPLVELLISSNIARYAEFKCFTRVLTSINEHLEQVPCSRADVFSTKNVSVVEKRMLMKLLTFCLEYQKHPDEYRGFEGRPFIRFLRSKKLTPNIEHYVLHAIAMVDESTPTLQGLQATQKFLESLGRYGNSPFLWTCYGSAELPQCFCRLCAVFGGIYYLNRSAEAVVLDTERKCKGIISAGQKLACEWLVMESSYAALSFLPLESPERISRAILITDSSLLPAEKEQITLLRLPPIPGVRGAITVFELGPQAYVCPDDLYVVHMICRSSGSSAFDDFKPTIQELFLPLKEGGESKAEKEGESDDQKEKHRPEILWCVFFNQRDTTVIDLNCQVPSGVLLTSSPGLEQDYDEAVKEAQELFSKICPGEEFLPRAPDPEDIIMEENPQQSNPGNVEDEVLDECEEVKELSETEEKIPPPDEIGVNEKSQETDNVVSNQI